MGFANRAIVAAGLGFAVSALVGCGGSGGLLSGSQADRLNNQLSQASQDLAAYQCRDATRDITNFRNSVDSLNSVNATLIGNLDQGASTIQQLASTECPVDRQTRTTKTATTRTNTDTTATTTTNTATDTTPTQTTPSTTVITLTTPTDTTTTGTGTTGTSTTPGSGGTGFGGTTTTVTNSTGFGDGAQGTG
jgi:hypothetical protein